MAQNFFSIDLGEHFVKIADVEKKPKGYDVKSFGLNESISNIYSTQTEKDIKQTAELIANLVHDAEIKKKEVNLIIPDSHSYSRLIEMPSLTEKELVSAIKYQADQFIPIPIDKVTLDIEIVNTDKKNKKNLILIVAAANTVLEKVTSIIGEAGLLPGTIENETSATLRLLSDYPFFLKKNETSQTASVFINFGHSSSSIYFIDNVTGLPQEIHNFPLGFEIFLKDVQANFPIESKEIAKLLQSIGFSENPEDTEHYNLAKILVSPYNELIAEIERFMVAAKSKFGTTISAVYLFGEGIRIHLLEKKLQGSLGITVQILDLAPAYIKNSVTNFFSKDLSFFIPVVGGNLH